MDMKIGFALTQETDALVDLINLAYRGSESWTGERDLISGARTDSDEISALIADAQAQFLVLRDEAQQILGCIVAEKAGDYVYLGMFAINPSVQQTGLGKALLAGAEHFSRGYWCGIKGSKMTVITARTELLAYYERRGYVQSNELQAFPRDINVGEPKQELQLVTLYKPFRA